MGKLVNSTPEKFPLVDHGPVIPVGVHAIRTPSTLDTEKIEIGRYYRSGAAQPKITLVALPWG